MRIDNIGNLTGMAAANGLKAEGLGEGQLGADGLKSAGGLAPSGGAGFGDVIRQALENVNNLQAGADVIAQKLATGDVEDIHQVMLALSKASTAFDLTVQVRNKVVEAYQEVMRMQV